MRDDDLEAAISRVAPALNIMADSIVGLPNFIVRASGREESISRALGGIDDLVVLLGTTDAALAKSGEHAGKLGVAALPEGAQAVCRRLIVAWEDREGRAAAAAFELDSSGKPGQPLGTSWTRPEFWPKPMVDTTLPPREQIFVALEAVRNVIAEPDAVDFAARLERRLSILDMAVQLFGGECSAEMVKAPQNWDIWFKDLENAVLDEVRRVAPEKQKQGIRAATPIEKGPLTGIRVFLSYARLDASRFAWPVNRALRKAGAQVWFDQEEPLEEDWLDAGLAAHIADCDAIVVCASDEYFERAGYATQELGWALVQLPRRGRLRRFTVVTLSSETILPSILDRWPRVEFGEVADEKFGQRLAAALMESENLELIAIETPPIPATPPSLPLRADLDALSVRVRHLRRFLDIRHDDALAVASSDKSSRTGDDARRKFKAISEDLDWDGRLLGFEGWPDDPMVRACRWDLACLRVLALLRWPLSGDLNQPDGIAPDLALILTRPCPIPAMPIACGWAYNDRRLFLRRQLGLLRVLRHMLVRGLYGALIAEKVNSTVIDGWISAADDRRREICDALIGMRTGEVLSWQGDPPTWDGLFRRFDGFLTSLQHVNWQPSIPAPLLMLMGVTGADIAAVAADVTWTGLFRMEPTHQRYTSRNWVRQMEIEVWSTLGSKEPSACTPDDNVDFSLGFTSGSRSQVDIVLKWRDLESAFGKVPAGWARTEAPAAFHRALTFEIC
jgi:hypothetical protein